MTQTICDHFDDLMEKQNQVIQNHIDEHKYYEHIKDLNVAIISFIKKYGWMMREVYCLSHCPHSNDCEVLNNIIEGKL